MATPFSEFQSAGAPLPVPSNDGWERLIPLRDQVLVQPEPPKDRVGGIIIPDSAKQFTFRGRVIAVSWFLKNAYEGNGVPPEYQVRELDRVAFTLSDMFIEDPNKMLTGRLLIPIGNIVGKIVKENS